LAFALALRERGDFTSLFLYFWTLGFALKRGCSEAAGNLGTGPVYVTEGAEVEAGLARCLTTSIEIL
jgi:hypothetical protein